MYTTKLIKIYPKMYLVWKSKLINKDTYLQFSSTKVQIRVPADILSIMRCWDAELVSMINDEMLSWTQWSRKTFGWLVNYESASHISLFFFFSSDYFSGPITFSVMIPWPRCSNKFPSFFEMIDCLRRAGLPITFFLFLQDNFFSITSFFVQ